MLWAGNGGTYFNPALQVAPHEIGGADKIFFFPPVVKVEDTGVLKKSAHHGNHSNVIRQSGNTGAKPA